MRTIIMHTLGKKSLIEKLMLIRDEHDSYVKYQMIQCKDHVPMVIYFSFGD